MRLLGSILPAMWPSRDVVLSTAAGSTGGDGSGLLLRDWDVWRGTGEVPADALVRGRTGPDTRRHRPRASVSPPPPPAPAGGGMLTSESTVWRPVPTIDFRRHLRSTAEHHLHAVVDEVLGIRGGSTLDLSRGAPDGADRATQALLAVPQVGTSVRASSDPTTRPGRLDGGRRRDEGDHRGDPTPTSLPTDEVLCQALRKEKPGD
ncbi:MAG: hypothetical protein WBO45_18105 [Planctomycetota bacterium]